MANHIISYFTLEFPGKKYSKAKKNYISHLQEDLESHLISTTSTGFGITISHNFIREYIESHPFSYYHQSLGIQYWPNQWQDSESHPNASNLFINAFDIFNIILLPIKASAMGYPL